MKFFIDTANLQDIEEAQALGVLDGVTTNPSLMAKEGITGKENILKHYLDICNIVDGDVSAEVISTDFDGMIREGEELAALHPQIVVKLPMIGDGIKACKYFSSKGPDLLGEGTNWQNELFQTGLIQNYNLSASGGSDTTTYALGMSYFDQEGTIIGSSFDRMTIRAVLDSQVKKWMKVGVNLNVYKTNQVTTVNDDSVILTALKQTPNVAARNADGNFDGPYTTEFVQTNPLGIAMLKDNHGKDYGIRGNVYAEISFTKDLKFKTQYSIDYNFGNRYTFNPSYTFGALSNEVREGSRTKSTSDNWIWLNALTYNKVLGKHNIDAMLSEEMQEQNWENLYGYRSRYLTNGATDLNAGDPTTARNSNASSTKSLSSYFARAAYSFDDRYFLSSPISLQRQEKTLIQFRCL
jgi:hypothetical protein